MKPTTKCFGGTVAPKLCGSPIPARDRSVFRDSLDCKERGVLEKRLKAYCRRLLGSLGLTEDEVAFYDALEVNDSAVKVLGDETLQKIAKELVLAVRKNATIDWTVKESARAKLRVIVRRLLRKYGYPPDKQEKATQTVLEQAELLCKEWAC